MSTFNYLDWLPNDNPERRKDPAPLPDPDRELVERAVKAVEASGKDITGDYATWRDLGFALAQLQEDGRDLFHRISRSYPGYDPEECDEQFTRCLKSNGQGITLGTFFHHVRAAGVDLVLPKERGTGNFGEPGAPGNTNFKYEQGIDKNYPDNAEEEDEEEKELPVFPPGIYEQLPEFLRRVVSSGVSSEEKDLLLLGSLAALSSVLPGFHGIYNGMLLQPNLYFFVSAPASAGKGRLSLCKALLLPINQELREESKVLRTQYESELAEYNMTKGEKAERPVKPPEKMLFIPANNSSTGFFQLLYDNGGRGILFENEGDTLSNAVRTEYGNYSDGLRKGWQHEGISYYRRTDREYVEIEKPSISAVLSGTPRQVATLIPSAENGLFSRFLFYYIGLKPVWIDVFANDEEDLEEKYLQLGTEFFSFYKTLSPQQRIRITFSRKQKRVFHSYFTRSQDKYFSLKPSDYSATIRRMGVNCFRVAMVLTALRGWEEGNGSKFRQCDDRDFNIALQMAEVLLRHSSEVYASLPLEKKVRTGNTRSERFLEALPEKFNRQQYLEIGLSLKIPAKTAEKYITRFIKGGLLQRNQPGVYVNLHFGKEIELA